MSGGRPIRLQLKVVPGSSKDEVAGWLGDALKVRVGAPAERGRANAAVEKLVAEAVRIDPEDVHIVSGLGSPRKVIELSNVTEAELPARLDAPPSIGSEIPGGV